jgi:hypothetical protein
MSNGVDINGWSELNHVCKYRAVGDDQVQCIYDEKKLNICKLENCPSITGNYNKPKTTIIPTAELEALREEIKAQLEALNLCINIHETEPDINCPICRGIYYVLKAARNGLVARLDEIRGGGADERGNGSS